MKARVGSRILCRRLALNHRSRHCLRYLLRGLSENALRRSMKRRLRLYGDFFYSVHRLKMGFDGLLLLLGQKQRMKLLQVKAVLLWKFRRLILGIKAFRVHRILCEERRNILLKAKTSFSSHCKRIVARALLLKAEDEASRIRTSGHDAFTIRQYFHRWKSGCGNIGLPRRRSRAKKEECNVDEPRNFGLIRDLKKSNMIDPRSLPRHRLQSSILNTSSDLTIREKRKALAGEIMALVSQLGEIKSLEINQRY